MRHRDMSGEGDPAWVRVLEAHVQRRSTNYRQNGAHQPVGSAADSDRRDAAGGTLSSVAGSREGTELQRQRVGGLLDPGGARPEIRERSGLEYRGAIARRGGAGASTRRTDGARGERSGSGTQLLG